MAFIEPCFGIGHNLSLICQMTSEHIKHQLIIIIKRAIASYAVVGCARGAHRSRSGFSLLVVSVLCVSIICLLFVEGLVEVVNNSVGSCHGCYTHIYPYWAMPPYRKVTDSVYIVLVCYIEWRVLHSGTFLQTLPDFVTPLKGHSLCPRSCPATRSAPSERFVY